MKRGPLPLTALRSFEAAGRLLSFTHAAAELHVSQAAISRQIRDLERQLGRPLFERHHRAVLLTPEGATLLEALTTAFDGMDRALSRLAGQPQQGLVRVNAEPSIAGCWLVPNLPEFRARHPEIDVVIETDLRLVPFRGHSPDLALRYSRTRSEWPEVEVKPLYPVEAVVVARPDLLSRVPEEDVIRLPRLHEESRDLWGDWLEMAGLSGVGPDRGPIFADGFQVLQAALDGQGIALTDRVHAGRALATGALVQLHPARLACGHYYLVTRRFARLSRPARQFAEWLQASLGRSP